MADQGWDPDLPVDHTKVSALPSEVGGLKSSIKTIIQKEHVALGASNSGGQHLKGAARVYLSSALPSSDPESENLDTSATSDDGRVAVVTGGGPSTGLTNTLKVYVATSVGISDGWQDARAAYAGTAVRVELDNNVPLLARKAGTPATTVDMIKVNANDVPELLVGSVLSADTDPSTGVGVVPKKYADAAAKAQMKVDNVAGATFGNGSESVTLANGLIIKTGKSATPTGDVSATGGGAVSFGVNFPNGITSVFCSPKTDDASSAYPTIALNVYSLAVSGFSWKYNEVGLVQNQDGFYWLAIGY